MSLWVDKYRPTSLAKLDYHKEQAANIKQLVHSGDFPHLLVYGPSGAGKKTRIMCLLRELYGSGVEKLRLEHNNFTTPSNRKIEITTIASNYHIEVNPRFVILTEVDHLTKDAQHALRRTMEKYMATCRIILCCNSTSKVIPAIRSRCLGIRVAAPSIEEICQILHNVCRKEGLNLPSELAKRLAEKSERNLRKALLMCEACKVQQLLEVRGRLYELLTHCIPPEVIMKGLLAELVTNCDGQLKAEVTQMAAFYEHRLQLGSKSIYHLEAFVAKFMSIYKRFLEDGMAAMDF
uniref:Replication factor C subunit 3-like n=1 Tax=Saccoglossus kowalevskii TaxID=10224 RepID=A0ABM0MK07_SACKO|nr:PREDICTED: replication factor C subunit 3-like [Saccoglossus kowalevskii]